MELTTLLLLVAALACPIGMGLMMWLMNKNMGGQSSQAMPGHTSEADRLKALQEQRRSLEQEIAEVEKIAALQAQKEALAHTQNGPADDWLRPVATK
ncbi:MAG: hypothetical protein AB1791_11845 [Chloroflexota bacterium]